MHTTYSTADPFVEKQKLEEEEQVPSDTKCKIRSLHGSASTVLNHKNQNEYSRDRGVGVEDHRTAEYGDAGQRGSKHATLSGDRHSCTSDAATER